MDRKLILSSIDRVLHERLFSAIKKLSIQNKRFRFEKTSDFQNTNSESRKHLLDEKFKIWYKSIDTFYLSFYSIFALVPLVKREKQILEFDSKEITIIRVEYQCHDGSEFGASHQTRFTADMKKEVEDCIIELNDPKYTHVVDNYKPEKDTEKAPHEPLTSASLKYSCFYLFQYDYKYTTLLSSLLFNADLITNIDTSGWNIEDDIVEEMITILNYTFKEEQVLQRKRTFDDKTVDRTNECIRPKLFASNYSPENIKNTNEFIDIEFEDGREKDDAFKLYEFIYNITLSTQLKNSIYDTSTVDIVVGQHKLKQKAHLLIEGQDNWELLSGKYINKIQENDNTEQGQSKTIILPEFMQDDILVPLSIYSYTYNSRRPRRYGVGRFADQILEREGIGKTSEHDEIISNLIDSKAVIQIQKVLNPQEVSLFFIDWLLEYAPLLTDLEYLKELEEKIELVEQGDLSLDSLIDELDRILDESFSKANYKEDFSKPSQAKINLINSIATKYKLNLEADIFDSNIKCDMLLALYPTAEPIKVGNCPGCNAIVYQKEYTNTVSGETNVYFSCEKFSKTNGCTFSIWDNKIEKFFTDKGYNLYTVEERKDALKKILPKKRGYLFSGLVYESKRKYNAKIAIQSFIPKDSKDKKKIWFLKVMKKEKNTASEEIKSDISMEYTNIKSAVREIILKTKDDVLRDQLKELEEKNKQLVQKNFIDYLTGANNRSSLDNDLELFWKKGVGSLISLAFIDGDKFKDINDNFGHDGGDAVIIAFVEIFKKITENLKARVYRFGGDEFCIIFREDPEIAKAAMEAIRIYVENNPIIFKESVIKTSITIGLALCDSSLSWKELIVKADEMLYKAKDNGRNCIKYI